MTRSRRRQINRQNAQKSTGPKSAEGKERSRANALTHGLRAETLALPHEDVADVRARTEEWFDHYEPENPAERALVEQAALASLRLHRCSRFEQATIARQVALACEVWERKRAVEHARLSASLRGDPAAARALRQTAAGCLRLAEAWEGHREILDMDGCWHAFGRYDDAVKLLGVDSSKLAGSPTACLIKYHNDTACAGAQGSFRDQPPDDPDDLTPGPAASRVWLRKFVDGEIARHRELALALAQSEEQERVEAADRALMLEDGPAVRLFLRYQTAAHNAFHRAYNALTKLDNAEVDDESDFLQESPAIPEALVDPALPNEANAGAESCSSPCTENRCAAPEVADPGAESVPETPPPAPSPLRAPSSQASPAPIRYEMTESRIALPWPGLVSG